VELAGIVDDRRADLANQNWNKINGSDGGGRRRRLILGDRQAKACGELGESEMFALLARFFGHSWCGSAELGESEMLWGKQRMSHRTEPRRTAPILRCLP
jgi:hypothetical protein